MKKHYTFQDFIKIVETLRGPHGCPWDKKQTHESLVRWAIEEAYELSEAIENKNFEDLKGELGDLLLQIALHSVIADENKLFAIDDVIQGISEKMIRRHPHVFSDKKANLDEVYKNWEKIKKEEQKSKPQKKEGFHIPHSLPALLTSQKIGEKTKAQNFDWQNVNEVKTKVLEELNEFLEALDKKNEEAINEEFGDLLFSLTQLGRHLDIEAEKSLKRANQKFEKRYFEMKKLIEKDGHVFNELQQNDKDKYWEQVKLISF